MSDHKKYYNKYKKYKNKNKHMLNNIPTITVPKNTLLFRVVNEPVTDYAGVKLTHDIVNDIYNDKVNSYCIPKEYNVFFYTSPFIVDGLPQWFSSFKTIEVYAVNYDIKILSMIGNSKYNRSIRTTDNGVATSCNKITDSCLKSGRYYDLCLTEQLIKSRSDVLGWTAITKNDAKKFMKEYDNFDQDVKKYVQVGKDNRGVVGPVEIALYPLKKRKDNNVFISDVDTWLKQKDNFNYRHIITLDRDKKKIIEFMDRYAELNENTKFYEYKL
jgi:hypothetical protein